MIDIHTHILPGMDDGSKTMEDSLIMAEMALRSGVDTMIVTPHSNVEGIFDNYYDDAFIQSFRAFDKVLKERKLPLTVAPGMEVYASEDVPELLRQGRLITLNHSRYLLIEFNFYEDLGFIEYLLTEILESGYCPIIAHPERYHLVQKHTDIAFDWLEMGASLQVNKDSILGTFGYRSRETAFYLLEHNLASLIASDAHNPYRRTADMSEVYHFVRRVCGMDYANILFCENPKRVLKNLNLVHIEVRSLY
jgi:protein-tyrosine phosphatase